MKYPEETNYDINNLTLESIKEAINGFFSKQRPDIVILEKENYFSVTIDIGKNKLYTGKGGLKMIFEQNIPFLVVEYNGKILDEKEYEQLKRRICI